MSDDVNISKGLGFPVLALAGVGFMPVQRDDVKEAARATQRLVIGVGWDGGFGEVLCN